MRLRNKPILNRDHEKESGLLCPIDDKILYRDSVGEVFALCLFPIRRVLFDIFTSFLTLQGKRNVDSSICRKSVFYNVL